VIAHEYFHNWTGDRVTCRDWFQLTLKEGLTVYRVRFVIFHLISVDFSLTALVAGPRVQLRHEQPRRFPRRNRSHAACRAVPRGQGPHGAPRPPRFLHQNVTFFKLFFVIMC
jgi:hypothetical protein